MLHENLKNKVENYIYNILKESMFENNFFENSFQESNDNDSSDNDTDELNDKDKEREHAILDWLSDNKEKQSVLAYKLWPDKDKDSARSLMSKKIRGKDADNISYHFTPHEINKLYNFIHSQIKDSEF